MRKPASVCTAFPNPNRQEQPENGAVSEPTVGSPAPSLPREGGGVLVNDCPRLLFSRPIGFRISSVSLWAICCHEGQPIAFFQGLLAPYRCCRQPGRNITFHGIGPWVFTQAGGVPYCFGRSRKAQGEDTPGTWAFGPYIPSCRAR